MSVIQTKAEQCVEGHSLPQGYYLSEDIYTADLKAIFSKSWSLVGHVSQLGEVGSYFLADVAEESIIVVRSADGVRAFFNVCRHRGSRLCLQASGKASAFVCPYHAWSYQLDGKLRAAPMMGKSFERDLHNLHPCRVATFEGLIFLNLDPDALDFNELYGDFRSFLCFQNVEHARLIEQRDFPTAANWKLVSENFFECYHCAPAHPDFMVVHDRDQVIALGGGVGSATSERARAYEATLRIWEDQVTALGHVTGAIAREGLGLFDFAQAFRIPLKAGC